MKKIIIILLILNIYIYSDIYICSAYDITNIKTKRSFYIKEEIGNMFFKIEENIIFSYSSIPFFTAYKKKQGKNYILYKNKNLSVIVYSNTKNGIRIIYKNFYLDIVKCKKIKEE